MSKITVDIINWEKFNPRNDRANHSWFRFQNGFFENQDLFGVSNLGIACFLFILCTASKKGSSKVEISLPYFSALRKATEDEIIECLRDLTKRGVIVTVESRREAVIEPSLGLATLQDNTLQDNTEQQLSTTALTVVEKTTPVTTPKKTSEQLISEIPRKTFERWSDLYDDPEFLQREVKKAVLYYENIPRKCPKNVKGWTQALNNWFARGWDYRARSIKGKMPAGKIDIGAILKGAKDGDDSSGF